MRDPDDQRSDYDDHPADGSAARHLVRGPGLALAVLGWLGIAGGGGLCAVCLSILTGAVSMRRPVDEAVTGVFAALGVVAVAVGSVVALGGHRLLACRDRGLVTLGACFCICSFPFLSFLGLLVAPFGVWALVALRRSEVKAEFARVRGLRRAAEEPR